jgi:hypothetical protein
MYKIICPAHVCIRERNGRFGLMIERKVENRVKLVIRTFNYS